MNKNFTQPFLRSEYVRAYLLIEVGNESDEGENDKFLEFWSTDDGCGCNHCDTLVAELSDSGDITTELAKFLYENGFALESYRELVRETSVTYSLVGDEPGVSRDEICLYVRADRTVAPLPECDEKARFVTLDKLLDDLEISIGYSPILAAGIAQIMNERDMLA